MSKIPVAEMFYSVQGEGPHAGTPAVFLRLAGCNLKCGLDETDVDEFEKGQDPEGDATWVCDTIDVWREPEGTYEIPELVDEFRARGFIEAFNKGAHLILTGGEPTMVKRQEQLSSFLDFLEYEQGVEPFVEVETNGTVEPRSGFSTHVDLFNVSLKLSNSGQSEMQRINDEAIKYYIIWFEELEEKTAKFKFVVAEDTDMQEVWDLKTYFDIPDEMMSLMPAGRDQDELEYTYPDVAELCKEQGWDFSPRLHIDIWNEMTGV